MHNEENTSKIYNNLYMEFNEIFSHGQTNISSLNVYNNSFKEWSENFTQDHENQSNSNLPTEWSPDFTQNQTNKSLQNVYNNPFVELSASFTQNHESQTNYNFVIECSTGLTRYYEDQTNNNLFTESATNFTQNENDINLLKTYKNLSIGWSADFTQGYGDQVNHNLSTERATYFIQNQIINVEITQHYKEQINTLRQQDNAKSVIENKHPVSLVSRRKKRQCYEKCIKCNYKRILVDKTSKLCRNCYEASLRVLSGNKLIDDFIELTQISRGSIVRDSKLEFIPYEKFTNIEYIAKGGFSIIYKATWGDGPLITRWCHKKQRYNRKRNYNVVLKCLNNSEKMDSDCLNELKNFFKGKGETVDDAIHRYIGISQDPKTKNYIIVMKFAQNRDLHYFINKSNTLSWLENLNLLNTIALGLLKLHRDFKLIHSDLHSGNILIDEIGKPTIADLGLSKPMDASSDKNAIYGVIPYVAPEVSKGGKFTSSSDIYSFGMIIWEVINGCRPFSDRKHDECLILDILDGLRPKIPSNIPQDLVELMNRYWDSDPEKRCTNVYKDITILLIALLLKQKKEK
ncbi:kinase-like domain-containing protein [Gigaspora rosea]|uniref:Kinase-like domain-containing protein n=1 Tax=Gigaspora rosea TaxID=44941 RepID=A0A397W9I9_9GLOM|nr:kinase-like domain-containing protein [Gigaspora rosea]